MRSANTVLGLLPCLVLAGLFAGPALLLAQTSADLQGLVHDASGAPISGATVRALDLGTGAERTVRSDETGFYSLPQLSPGRYRVRVLRTGFRESVGEEVLLRTGTVRRLDFQLEVGGEDEVVTVVAEQSFLSRSPAEWGGELAEVELTSLPAGGRDLFGLAFLAPGATIPEGADKGLTSGQGTWVSVFGSRPNMNSFQLDGLQLNDATGSAPASAASRLLGVEGVEEVRIVTSPFSAQYGRTAGAVIMAVSKSGTNDFHGSLYGYFRNSALDARNFFDRSEEGIPPLRRSQYGGLLGGPIRRDKVFFFLNYEGLRGLSSETVRPVVPTESARRGSLPQPDGTVKEVPVAPQMPVYLSLYPLPNGRDFGNGTGEFTNESTTELREDYVSGKLDFLASEDLRLAGQYVFDDAENSVPDPLRLWTFTQDSRYQFFSTRVQKIHSSQTISDFHAGLSQIRNSETSQTGVSIPPELSFVQGQPLGSIQVTGLDDLGGLPARLRPREFSSLTAQFGGGVVLIRGRHSLRLGVGFDRLHFDQRADISATGAYRFGSLEDFLRGQTLVGEVMAPGSDSKRNWRFSRFNFYLQDEMRLRSALTLNIGLRYDAATTPIEVNGKIATLPDPVNDSTTTVGGPLFDNPSWFNLAPRLGVAWDPFGRGRTVVRAGGGIFFDLLGARELVVAGARVPPLFRRLFLAQPQFPDILGAVEDVNPKDSLDGLDFNLEQPYVGRWQVGVDHRLGRDLILQVSYVGSRGVNLPAQLGNINPTRPERLEDGTIFFPPDTPRLNPAFESIGMRRTGFNAHYHAGFAALEKRLTGSFSFRVKYTFGKSIDESSSTVFDDFLGSDLVPTMFDYRMNRGFSDFDLRHSLVGSVFWRNPIRRGGLPGLLLNSWELNGIVQAQTGFPFAPRVGFDRARLRGSLGDLGQRPDWIGGAESAILGDPDRYFNPSLFGLPEPGTYGTLGRGTLSGPGLALVNVALARAFWSDGPKRFLIRGEFLNLFNRANFQIPSGLSLFDGRGQKLATAGRITATSTPAREIQLAVRFEF